jgi:hypothetical protein
MASDDPDFESKAADIIGLYLNPLEHAAVFCVDEKTAIQALDRLDPVPPLSPGRIERHGFEYYRHGTLSLYAALETATGRVHGMTAARHTSQDSLPSSMKWSLSARPGSRFTSSSTTSRLTRLAWSKSSCTTTAGSFLLHTDLLFVAQPGRAMVRQNRARSDCPRRLHFGPRPGPQNRTLHQGLLCKRQAHSVEILRPGPPHP